MKLSELIEALRAVLEEHGDLKVEASVPYSPGSAEPELDVRDDLVTIFGDG